MKVFHFQDDKENVRPDFYNELIEMFGNVSELRAQVKIGQEARNAIFYATSKGYPTGFDEPEVSLSRECQVSLGLLWAALDMNNNKGNMIPFYAQALKTAHMAISNVKSN